MGGMMLRSEQYEAAARRVEAGWVQRRMLDPDGGGACLIGALREEGVVGRYMGARGPGDAYDGPYIDPESTFPVYAPREVGRDVEAVLRRSPYYRFIRWRGWAPLSAAAGWNDRPGRRARTVAGALRAMAARAREREAAEARVMSRSAHDFGLGDT